MKAYSIALFMLCFIFAINILAVSQTFGETGIYYGDIAQTIQSSLQSDDVAPSEGESISYTELAISSFGLLIRSLVAIILVFGYSTLLLPVFLNMLGLPTLITAPITLIVWVSYVIGYAQYKARTSLMGAE